MDKRIVTTNEIAPPGGPFSPGVEIDGWLFLSGQVGQDPKTGRLVEGDITRQMEQLLRNVEAVLKAGGRTFTNVIQARVFLADMGDFAAMNAVYTTFFQKPYPARTTVAVKSLPLGAAVEMDVIAR
ncbi:MAG TPA: Rid family detoxifying hydrolase [Candidatus Polarisedimenticolia bacterium]|nr:Rid family detoxifying hydrolase [Candidatus Polarisedimenticolia bacterium]